MDKELELQGYSVDPATGFLEKKEKNTFGARAKTAFLKDLKKTGNQSKSLRDLGFTNDDFDFAVRKDLIFNKAYRGTLLEMRHELEGDLYTAGLEGNAKKAQMWLQAFFPETYKPSAAKPAKKEATNPVLDALYDKAMETNK